MAESLKRFTPHKYQELSLKHLDHKHHALLFLDCGMGKTVITLTYLWSLLYDYFKTDANKILIVAPKKVAEDTWTAEQEKWDHLKELRISKVLGTPKQRLKALEQPADIYIINRELVSWLVAGFEDRWPFDVVIIDELSSFKSPDSDRFRALKQVVDSGKVNYFVGLTGTPQPRGIEDLWAEVYLADQGERLGKTFKDFREHYFDKELKQEIIRSGAVYKTRTFYDYTPKPGAEEIIQDKIKDIAISLAAEDWLNVPEAMYIYHEVQLCKNDQKNVKIFTREKVLELEEATITAGSAAQVALKLLQIANGAIYDEDKNVHEIHDAKLDKLEELIEAANGKPIMIFYWFAHDRDRILKRLNKLKLRISDLKNQSDRIDWNVGKIDIALVHPASMGHGLNLQDGGNIIVWFSMTFDLEIYIQANARLHRQGQKQKVLIHHIVCKNTYDEEAVERLKHKDGSQKRLIQSLKARLKKDKKE